TRRLKVQTSAPLRAVLGWCKVSSQPSSPRRLNTLGLSEDSDAFFLAGGAFNFAAMSSPLPASISPSAVHQRIGGLGGAGGAPGPAALSLPCYRARQKAVFDLGILPLTHGSGRRHGGGHDGGDHRSEKAPRRHEPSRPEAGHAQALPKVRSSRVSR